MQAMVVYAQNAANHLVFIPGQQSNTSTIKLSQIITWSSVFQITNQFSKGLVQSDELEFISKTPLSMAL
jgi:hypothetical protein